jgi:hypothetical protein
MRKRAADIEAEPALIVGASYSLHVQFMVRAACSNVVASSPTRDGDFRMRQPLHHSGSHVFAKRFDPRLHCISARNSLAIIGLITTDLAASTKCTAVTGMAVSASQQKPEERGIAPCCSFC